MEKQKTNFIKSRLFVLILLNLILVSCGHNIKYIEKDNYSGKIQIRGVNCDEDTIMLKLDTISILNTVKDTFIVQSHVDLNINLDLTLVNKSNKELNFIIDKGDFQSSNFQWIIYSNNKKHIVNFYDFNHVSEYNINPKDSISFSIESRFFKFENLIGNQLDNTSKILDLLKNFELTYSLDENNICVEQSKNSNIYVYNRKSKWSFW